MDENIKKNFERLNNLLDSRQEKYATWLKGIITIATGLIALLISLKAGISRSPQQHYFFIATIVLLASGILFGTATLYREVTLLDRSRKAIQKHIKLQLEGFEGDLLEMIESSWIYKLFSYISVLSFLIALISLVCYAFYLDK